jgi:hypothetical protein
MDGCFGLLFLIHLLSRQTISECDEPNSIARFAGPDTWAATRPTYRNAFNCDFDMLHISQRRFVDAEMLGRVKWSALFKDTPFPFALNIKELHGPVYKHSAHCLSPQAAPGGVVDGGVLWELPQSCGTRTHVLCNPFVAVAALRAVTCNPKFLDLSFAECGFNAAADHCGILNEMGAVLMRNTALNSVVFPSRLGYKVVTHKFGVMLVNSLPTIDWAEQNNYIATWVGIGNAIMHNPRPLLIALNMSGCLMSPAGLDGLLPGLAKLYQQLGLAPRVLNFSDNNLNVGSVFSICGLLTDPFNGGWCVNLAWLQELSFGNNAWCDTSTPIVKTVCGVLRKATSLRVLDLSSTFGSFPTPQLREALDQSRCPLQQLTIGGCPVDPAYAVRYCHYRYIMLCINEFKFSKCMPMGLLVLDSQRVPRSHACR